MASELEESEVKLDLHPAVELPPLEGVVEGAVVEAQPEQVLTATYFDTDDLRLIRAGVTLRHRPEEGTDPWQVKIPVRADADGTTRLELAFPGGSRRPPVEARRMVVARSRGADLRAVARLVTTRRTTVLRDADGTVLAEVADDEVTAYRGSRLLAKFREVEVEGGRRKVRRAIAAHLTAAGATATDGAPKLVRALGPDATMPDDLDLPPAGDPDPAVPVGEVVSRALLTDLARMVRHDPGTRLDLDIEQLHQMRVATRRLRTTLRTYGPVLDEAWATGLREDLRELAGVLGAVRDLDVLLERVRKDLRRIEEADAAAADRLLTLLDARRADARARLATVMDGRDYPDLLERVRLAALDPRCLDPTAPAGPTLAPLVTAAGGKVSKAATDGEHLHDVRLRIKRLRYAADAVLPAFGGPAATLSSAAADAQDVLGTYQDADVAIAAYRSLLPEVDVEVAFVLGRLTQRATRRRTRAERSWPAAWTILKRPRLRRFLT